MPYFHTVKEGVVDYNYLKYNDIFDHFILFKNRFNTWAGEV